MGTLGAAYGIGSIARGFGSFDADIHTLMAEAGPDIENVGGQKGLTQSILDISGSTQFSSGATAELLIQMVKDGVKLQDALANIPSVLKLAVAESTDLTTAWNTTNTFVSGLNVPLSESVRLMDMMSNATSQSKLKLENIQYIAGQSLALYKEIGGFSEEGFLGISGILGPLFRPERIGTGLKQLSLLLPQAASGQLAGSKNDVFASWGVNITDAAGNLKDEVSVLKEFERVMGGMTGEQRNVELAKVFGTEAAPVFAALIGQSKKLAENMHGIRKAGTLDEKFAVHSESLKNKWDLLTSAGDSLIKKFIMILNEGEAFGGGIGWVTEKIKQFTGFMEANKDTIQAWWGNFREIIGGLFNFVATGIETVANFWTNFWSGLSEGEKTIVAIGAVIGAFVLGPVTGLIAAGALIVAKWDEIKDFFSKLWDGKSFRDKTMDVVNWIQGQWDEIKDFFSRLFDNLDELVTGFVKSVSDNTMSVVNWIRRQWDEMSPYFKKIWDGISFVANNAWKVIRFAAEGAWEFIKILWQPVSAFFKMLWQGVLLATEFAWFAVKNVIKGVVLAIEGLWNGLKAVFNWEPVKLIRKGFMALVDFFANLVGKLKAPFEDFIGFVTGIFETIAKGIETVRGWFRRGEEGEHKLVLTVDTKQAQKEVKSAIGASGTLKEKMNANAPKIKRVPEEMRNLTPEQFVHKQKVDKFLEENLSGTLVKLISNLAASQASGRIIPIEADKTAYYQTRAKTAEAASGISKPEASYQDFLKEQSKNEAEASRRAKSFGVNLKPRAMLGTRAVEKMYKIDDRAMANVREHFEDVAEKEFFSRLETYAEQSFSHIDSTLTEAQRSMRDKAFAAQKFLREDAARWKKIVESGTLERFSDSVKAAGVTAENKEIYGYLQKALAGDSFLSMPEQYQHLQADNIPSVLHSLQGRISPDKLGKVIDMFENLSQNAAYMPGMQRALKIDSLSEDIGKGIEAAGLKRGNELLLEVMKSSDTVTQAKARLPESDAASLQSAYEYLKPYADKLPMMQKLLARESMLTGEPQGTKMNVFEFPTLTAEQHEALTSTFNSGFLSLIDIESAQLAVLQSIAGVLGAQNTARVLGTGSVIKEQKGTLYDDYLSHRHSQTYKQVSEQIHDNTPQVASTPSLSRKETIAPSVSVAAPSVSVIAGAVMLSLPSVSVIAPYTAPNATVIATKPTPPAPQPPTTPQTTPGLGSEINVEIPATTAVSDPSVSREGNIAPVVSLVAPSVSAIAGEVTLTPPPTIAPNTNTAAVAPTPQPPTLPQETTGLGTPPALATVSPASVDTAQPSGTVYQPPTPPAFSTELPIITAEMQDVAAPHVPVIHPEMQDAVAPHVPVIQPQLDPRFENILDFLQPQPPTPPAEQSTATDAQIVKTSEGEKTINNTFNITIEAGDRSAEELYEEIMAIAQERSRENNF